MSPAAERRKTTTGGHADPQVSGRVCRPDGRARVTELDADRPPIADCGELFAHRDGAARIGDPVRPGADVDRHILVQTRGGQAQSHVAGLYP